MTGQGSGDKNNRVEYSVLECRSLLMVGGGGKGVGEGEEGERGGGGGTAGI